jgi:hypothetical protein
MYVNSSNGKESQCVCTTVVVADVVLLTVVQNDAEVFRFLIFGWLSIRKQLKNECVPQNPSIDTREGATLLENAH